MDRKNSVNEKREKIKELVEWEIKAEYIYMRHAHIYIGCVHVFSFHSMYSHSMLPLIRQGNI